MFRLRFSLSTLIIATLFAGAVYRIWWRGTDAWTLERSFKTGHLRVYNGSGQFNVAAISNDNRMLAATSNEQKLRMFSVNGSTLWTVDLIGTVPLHRLRFLDEDRVIEVQGSYNGNPEKRRYLNAHDATTITDSARLKVLEKLSEQVRTAESPPHYSEPALIRSPDCSRTLESECVTRAGDTEALYQWRLKCVDKVRDPEARWSPSVPTTMLPWAMQFSPDGKRFAVATFRQAFVCDNEDGHKLATMETGRWNMHLEFSQDGEYLAIVHPDSVSLWQRHWPDAWWGQFCRFEVWLTIVTGCVLAWRVCAAAIKALSRFRRAKENIPELVRA